MSRTHRSIGYYARTLRAVIVTALLLACGDSSTGPGTGGGGSGSVAQISITPSAPTITIGAQLPLQAQVRDASGNIITGASVFWSSADTTVVTISSTGIVTGKGLGTAQVAASSGGQSARAVVTVSSAPVATVSVLPAAATLVVGGTTLLKALTYDANQVALTGRTIAWASSATQVASVDATGKVIGVAAGTATITATSEGQTGKSTITVTVIPIGAISITPSSAALTVGQSASLTAIATDANGNTLGGRPITWKSSDSTIAAVSTGGLVTAVSPGSVNISATAEGKTASAQVVVTSATPTPVGSVVVSPTTASIIIGGSATLSATVRDGNGALLSGRAVTWVSSAPATATVSSSGVVTAIAAGTTTITATSEGKSGTASVTVSNVPVASIAVTPTSSTLLVGGATATLTAVTKDSNGNVLTGRVVNWTSSALTVATVSSTGVVTPVGPGNTTITATSEGQSATSAVGVSLAPVATITVSPTSASIVVGSATAITAVVKDANGNVLSGRITGWTSNTPGVATVDANGMVTAVSAGNATITATSEGKSATATITVSAIPVANVTPSPSGANLFVGATLAMSAVTTDANNNALPGRVVTWSTSSTSIATVNATSGIVTAVGAGTATITATSEGKTGTASIVVTFGPVATVSVTPPTATLYIGGPATTLTAVLKDAYGNVLTGRSITWASTNTAAATVDANGVVTPVAVGNTSITATSEGKTSNASAITVSTAPVATVTVTAPTTSLIVGGPTTTLSAVLKDAYGNVLTGRVIAWVSSDPSVATVSTSGVVTAVAVGNTSITATSETKFNSPATSMTVTTAPVATVTVTAPTTSLIVGGPTTTLTAVLKDAYGNVLAGRLITWASTDPSVATVSASGVVTAVAAGTTSLIATSETIPSGPTSMTVSLEPVASVEITPAVSTISASGTSTVQLTAAPKSSGGTTLSLTGRTVVWTSGDVSIATVDNTGLVHAAAFSGPVVITAAVDGVLGISNVTVNP